MKLVFNGQDIDTPALTVGGLLAELGLTRERIAVEVNLGIVPKKDYDSRALSDGDRVEVVNFVGGG